MSNPELVLKLFLQLTVILATCRLVVLVGRYLGQTPVVGEMIAGVLLGPSLFGLLAPSAQQWLFPTQALIKVGDVTMATSHPSMAILYGISQIGLALYMFLVGLEFNGALFRQQLKGAGLVSGTGVVIPFILGGAVAMHFYGNADFFRNSMPPWAVAVYMGASMSVTAFPVLARILHDKGIANTRFGTLALVCGLINDAIAWCLLAIILAGLKASLHIAVVAIGGGILYVLVMIVFARRALWTFSRLTERENGVTKPTLTVVLMIMMFCAWFTDFIGIHLVFGAFILGTVMPGGRFAGEVRKNTEFLTTSFLLPVFFVYSGLNTKIGLLNTSKLWVVAGLIILIAIVGKGLACMLAARSAGETWREAAAIGALMNARGLMELIILNIGREYGIITQTLFTIMVLMAIITTVMTSPLFQWIYGRHLQPVTLPAWAMPASHES